MSKLTLEQVRDLKVDVEALLDKFEVAWGAGMYVFNNRESRILNGSIDSLERINNQLFGRLNVLEREALVRNAVVSAETVEVNA